MKTTILICLIGIALVAAECPNACSGNGVCGPKDSCTCYKNYQGNDCSERTCPFGYAHVDTPKGDLDGDGDVDTNTVINSAGSIVYGASGTQEQFPDGDNYEAHFYQECSNKGLCNRKTGECDCLDGYEGTACQRASCPNACSGHGTCESIKELAELGPSTWVNSDATAVRGKTTYTLWDQDIGLGCLCDPEYQGADCSEKQCKYGVDPLYEAEGTVVNEEVYIVLSASDAVGGTYQLRFFDVFGEDWKTDYISVGSTNTAFCTNLVNGLKAIPNGVVSDATCTAGAISGGYGYNAIVVFDQNPGDLRTLEVWKTSTLTGTGVTLNVYGSPRNGEFVDEYSTKASFTVSSLANAATALTLSADGTGSLSAGSLIKIGKHHLAVGSITTNAVTLAFTYQGGAASSGDSIYISNAATAKVQDDTATDIGFAASVGDTTLVFSATPDNLSRGSVIYSEDKYYTVRSVSGGNVVVDEKFSGIRSTQTDADLTSATFFSAATDSTAYVITTASTSTYTYVSECSGRGTCDRSTGLCKCFKGYASDNCDTQNALAA